jgi:hypothetical protein
MYPIVEYIPTSGQNIVIINPNPRNTIKIGFTFMALGFFITSVSFFINFLQNTDGLILRLFPLAFSIIFLLLSLNYLKTVFEKEIIISTKDSIKIENKMFFLTNTKTYQKEKIDSVDFDLDESKPAVPGDSFEEITGIKFYQNSNNYLFKKGVISFRYNGGEVRFGKDLEPETALKVSRRVFR